MTVILEEAGLIRLEGDCPLEDAEPLLAHLLEHRAATVDWTACSHAHAAVVQVLMAARPSLVGPPGGAFLAIYVAPLLG